MHLSIQATGKLTLTTVLVTYLLMLSGKVYAMPDTIPPASVVPSLNGLNIAYLMKQDKVKVSLYIVNHEKFPVTCDAQYESGPETQHSLEQHALPEKAIFFSYTYAKRTGSIILQLTCVKPDVDVKAANSTEPSAAESTNAVSPGKEDPNPVIEIDLSLPQ